MQDKCEELLDQLAEIRKSKGLTQKELAKACGIPQSTIGKVETHTRTPQIDTFLKIIEKLGYTLEIVSPEITKKTGDIIMWKCIETEKLINALSGNRCAHLREYIVNYTAEHEHLDSNKTHWDTGEILKLGNIPAQERLYAVMRRDLLPGMLLLDYARRCEAQAHFGGPAHEYWKQILLGEITLDVLADACDAAYNYVSVAVMRYAANLYAQEMGEIYPDMSSIDMPAFLGGDGSPFSDYSPEVEATAESVRATARGKAWNAMYSILIDLLVDVGYIWGDNRDVYSIMD